MGFLFSLSDSGLKFVLNSISRREDAGGGGGEVTVPHS